MTPHDPAATWTWAGDRTLPDWIRHHHWHHDRPVINTADGPRTLYDGWMAILWTDGAITVASATVAERVYGADGIAGRLARAEAALARVQAIADEYPAGIDTALIHEALDQTRLAPREFQPFTPPHIRKTGDPTGALVIEPYRNDRHENVWVFRCWGTDTCDGWLSLDHHSEQSAVRARDRHVAEEHGEPGPAATQATEHAGLRDRLAATVDQAIDDDNLDNLTDFSSRLTVAVLAAITQHLDIGEAQAWCKYCRRAWNSPAHRCESDAEQRLQRIAQLRDQWLMAGAPPLGTPLARWWDKRLVELNAALNEEQPGPA